MEYESVLDMPAFQRLSAHAEAIETVADLRGVHEARRNAIALRNRIMRWERLGRLTAEQGQILIRHVEAQEAALKELES
ncbi:MAG: hypothetical protein ACOY94_19730 [Bacillota bacterium]